MEPVGRISYHPDDRGPAPRKLVTETHVVRLGWYRLLPAGTVHVISGPRRITLLVVPPQTPEDTARSVLERAADPTNTDVVDAPPMTDRPTVRAQRCPAGGLAIAAATCGVMPPPVPHTSAFCGVRCHTCGSQSAPTCSSSAVYSTTLPAGSVK